MRSPVHALPQYLPAKFETEAQVQVRRRRLVGQLARHPDPLAHALARRMLVCTEAKPCEAGACPVCQRRIRAFLLRDVRRLLAGRGALLRLSWIPAGGRVPVGELPAFDLDRFLASRQRALQRALPEVTIIFGGADVSLNTFENGGAYWQVHVYVILLAADTPDLRRRVRARCPGEPTAPRPFHFQRVSEPAEALSYAVKAVILRRSSFIDGNGRRDTRAQRLPAAQAVEAALYQDRWSMLRRLLLRGLRVVYRAEGAQLILPGRIAQSARSTQSPHQDSGKRRLDGRKRPNESSEQVQQQRLDQIRLLS